MIVRAARQNTKGFTMREVWNFVLGCLVGATITVGLFTYPVVCERNELRDTLNQVSVELDGRNIVIDWSDLLKKD